MNRSPPRMELTPGPPHLFIPVQFGNLLEATTTGIEVVGRWTPASWWRLEGGYSTFRSHTAPVAGEPRRWRRLPSTATRPARSGRRGRRSRSPLGSRLTPWCSTLAPFHSSGSLPTHAPTRGWKWYLSRQLSVSVAGQNLLDPRHVEYGGTGAIVSATEIPRSASVQLRWRY